MIYAIIALAGFLLGSLSVSIFISGKLLGRDVRSCGSGNAGATNMARVYGLRAGLITLLGDMLKAAAAMYLGWILAADAGMALGGICCVLGHCYPIFHGFKGGKGVSVGAAVALAIDWKVCAIIVAVFLIAALLSRRVSLGSVCAAAAIVPAALLCGASAPELMLAAAASLMVLLRHKENIRRLIAGTEPEFRAGKRADSEKTDAK